MASVDNDNQSIGSKIDTFDSYCDPAHPISVTLDKVLDAQNKIKNGVVRTPCTKTRLSETLGMNVYFKKEYMQYTGSFKDRGALYSLLNLTDEQKKVGVVTTSAGNHAQAMAHQGAKLGIPVTVVMPKTAPLVKVNSCRALNAEVILYGNHFDEAKEHAMDLRNKRNLVYINGYDHEDIIAGQGTVGLEILEDVPNVDCIIVPIGGGGLISGIATAVKGKRPDIRIIGVESQRCPSWQTAITNGRPIPCKKSQEGAKQSIADGLSVIEVGHNSFATACKLIEKVHHVDENFIAIAILRLLENEKAVVEGAGATGFAAILSGAFPDLQGKNVACVLCGGNIDANILGRVIERALVQEGRLSRFQIVVSDRPGGLAQLLNLLADSGASVKDIHHDRISLASYVYMTGLRVTIETRDKAHAHEVRELLQATYKDDVKWRDDRNELGLKIRLPGELPRKSSLI